MPEEEPIFVETSEEEFRWPQKGDRLLKSSDDWNKGASFSNQRTVKHAIAWSGYMTAADALIDQVTNGSLNQNFVIYPILFNYRHGLELALKWVIKMYGPHVTQPTEPDLNIHNLWSLWNHCRFIISEISPNTDKHRNDLQIVELIIKDFHELDKSSMALRYECQKDGTEFKLPEGVIDVKNLKNVMEGVNNFFSGADGQMADLTANDIFEY